MSKFSNILRISLISLSLFAGSLNVFASPRAQKNFKLKASYQDEYYKSPINKQIKLLSLSHLNEKLLQDGDFIHFKANKHLSKYYALPENARLETEVQFANNKESNSKTKLILKNIITENNEKVPCSGELELDFAAQNNPVENNKVIRFSSNIVTSGLVGAVDSIQYGGIPLLLASNGFSALTAASLGAIKGAVDSSRYKRKKINLASNSLIKVKVLKDLDFDQTKLSDYQSIQLANAESMGINLEVKKCKQVYSYNFGDSLSLELDISNYSGIDFDISDLILVNEDNSQEFLLNPFLSGFSSTNFTIKSNSHKNYKITYSLGDFEASDNYQLRILDPLSQKQNIYFPVKII